MNQLWGLYIFMCT